MNFETDDDEHPRGLTLSGKTVAGRYRVMGVLGQGGAGRVYVADQIGLDRKVALKVIRRDRREDPVTAQRFMREARAAGRIASPNVVTLYDFGRDGDEHYLAMELLEGQSLSERLKEGSGLGLLESVRVGHAVAKGLRAAHEAGVLHRDLKPGNVFLCKDGTVKVLDFGIAKLLDDEEGTEWEPLTAVNRIVGTPVYMSPEAATRRPLGPTTDLYALGLILHEMVVGEPPFRTGNAMKTLQAQVMEPAPPLKTAAPWLPVPEALDSLVSRLLEKDPKDRPRDAGEVAERLEQIERGLTAVEAGIAPERTAVDIPQPPGDPEPDTADRTDDGAHAPIREDGQPDPDATEVWAGRPWLEEMRSSYADAPAPQLPAAPPAPTAPMPTAPTAPTAPTPVAQFSDPPKKTGGAGIALLVVASILTGVLAFVAILVIRLLF